MKTLVTSLAVLWAYAATAGDSPASAEDRTQDRVGTQAEVQAVFAAIDRNQDDRISKDEASRAKTLRHRFAAVDSSGDGFVSRAEFMARPSDKPFE